jgi:hypothetical protein
MKTLVQEWSPGGSDKVTIAAGNAEQVVIATGSRALVYLEVCIYIYVCVCVCVCV